MARRAILVDAFGTLLELLPPAPALRDLLAQRHGIEVSLEQAQSALAAEMRHYRRECSRAGDASSLAALRLECGALLAGELGGVAGGLSAAEMVPTLLASLRFVAYPEVAATLDRWRAGGLVVVVASNWDVSLYDALRQAELLDRLDGVVTSAEVGCSKPAPELFAAALDLARSTPAETLHVGDSLSEDVEGAIAAGIGAVWLRRGGGTQPAGLPEGVAVVSTLAEVEP